MVADPYGQGGFGVRLDWGLAGARATQADVCVVVDVLSFSTAVTVAVERSMRVFPCRQRDADAEAFAAHLDASLAVARSEAATGAVVAPSLSPAGLMVCEAVPRLVLPSPNGSTIARELDDSGSTVAAGCLRNARAVATWLAPRVEQGRAVAVIAAGERRDDDSMRPALEDHLGAGSVLSELVALGLGAPLSPEAWAAAELFDAGRDRLRERLRGCVSGRELISWGFGSDVDVAAELNASPIVPVLAGGAFVKMD